MTTASPARSGRGRRSTRPSGDDREAAILRTAERLLETSKFADISVDDLAKGAGLSRPTFYFYFPSKEAVLLTLLDRVIQQADSRLRSSPSVTAPLIRDASLRAGINAFFATFAAHPAVCAAPAPRPWRTAPRSASSGRTSCSKWIDQTAGVIEAERAEGAAPVTLPAHDLATSLNLMNEAMMSRRSSARRRRCPATGSWTPSSTSGSPHLRRIPVARRTRCEHMFVLRRAGSDPGIGRTCVRVGRRGAKRPGVGRRGSSATHPARGPRLVLRIGRAARRPHAAPSPRDRRRRRRPCGELRSQGLRRAHRDGRAPGQAVVSARHRRATAHVGVLGGQRGGVRGVPRHHSPGRTRVRRRGLPRRRWPGQGVGHARADRGPTAGGGPRPGRAAHHRGHRAHQVPGQGRQPGGQARRPAAGAARS